MTTGVDYYSAHPGFGTHIKGWGGIFACRYYGGDPGKDLTLAEALDLHASGVATVGNWESSATSMQGGAGQGAIDGAAAGAQARSAGHPAGRPIYYSADFESSGWQLSAIVAYLVGAQQASGYPAGVYGSYATVDAAYNAGFRWLWQTAAWSGRQRHPAALIVQYGFNVTIAGIAVDANEATVDDFGQWGVAPQPNTPQATQIIAPPAVLIDSGGHPVNAAAVGMALTPNGKGYWKVGADGGVFTGGDAKFFGSAGGEKLNKPIVGIAARPQGDGYWMVASDGGVFSYGGATFHGSMGGKPLNKPVIGISATPSGLGYVLIAADYGVFAFGDATYEG